jgi:hypothetical protein
MYGRLETDVEGVVVVILGSLTQGNALNPSRESKGDYRMQVKRFTA